MGIPTYYLIIFSQKNAGKGDKLYPGKGGETPAEYLFSLFKFQATTHELKMHQIVVVRLKCK